MKNYETFKDFISKSYNTNLNGLPIFVLYFKRRISVTQNNSTQFASPKKILKYYGILTIQDTLRKEI